MCYERTAGRQRVHGVCIGSTGMGWEGGGSPIVDNLSRHSTASLVFGGNWTNTLSELDLYI